MQQIKNQFDSASLIKVFKGALIAGGAVALLYVMQWLITCDFGSYSALVVGLLSVVINIVKEYRKGE